MTREGTDEVFALGEELQDSELNFAIFAIFPGGGRGIGEAGADDVLVFDGGLLRAREPEYAAPPIALIARART